VERAIFDKDANEEWGSLRFHIRFAIEQNLKVYLVPLDNVVHLSLSFNLCHSPEWRVQVGHKCDMLDAEITETTKNLASFLSQHIQVWTWDRTRSTSNMRS
jgi:hypothetical protein